MPQRRSATKRSTRSSKSAGSRTHKTTRRAKSPSTRAGKFVKKEIEHAKRGKHPVKSRKQAIAIGLSKARRAGVKVPRKSSKSRRSTRRK
jgi:hypothetical protein